MIRYMLICDHAHEFEGWFSNSSDFDVQKKRKLIECPYCSSKKVDKSIMAPRVSTSRGKEAAAEKQAKAHMMMGKMADKIRKSIAENCEDVGENFAYEARAMHYGEKEERGIYGSASPDQAAELMDEGIGIAPLPDALVPKKKSNLN